jgi:hypothetical protein
MTLPPDLVVVGNCRHGFPAGMGCLACQIEFEIANKPSPLAEFDAAVQKVTQERGQVYGHPADDFAKAAKIKEAVASCPDPLLRHCLEMIGVKLARLAQTPEHLDSWIDVFGYARCAVMIMDRRNRKEAP